MLLISCNASLGSKLIEVKTCSTCGLSRPVFDYRELMCTCNHCLENEEIKQTAMRSEAEVVSVLMRDLDEKK
jgi:hypothetical protein